MKHYFGHLLRILCLWAFLLIGLFASPAARAATVEFEWDANPPTDEVTSYILFERLPDGTARKVVETKGPVTTATGDFAPGRHTVYVVARSGTAQSEPSDPLTFPVLSKPGTPRLKVTLQTSDNLTDWKPLAIAYTDETARQFFRATIERE